MPAFLLLAFLLAPGFALAQETAVKPMAADMAELQRAWQSAVVRLPVSAGDSRGYFLRDEASLNQNVGRLLDGAKLPLVIYLHDCDGLSYHREDIANLSRIGFAVIAPDSFARKQPPKRCHQGLQRYLKDFQDAAAFQKAELAYAINRIKALPWVDSNQLFLVGSGVGGMVAAQHQGGEFTGYVIEGWRCGHPDKAFSGIKIPLQARIYTVDSRNDGWYRDAPGFAADCADFLADRPDSVSVEIDAPARYASWYTGSRTHLIRFMTRDLGLTEEKLEALIDDTPIILEADKSGIRLRLKWSYKSIYNYAGEYCAGLGKKSILLDNTIHRTYRFMCS